MNGRRAASGSTPRQAGAATTRRTALLLALAVLSSQCVLAAPPEIPDSYHSRLTVDRPYLLLNRTVPLAAPCALIALGFGVAAVRRRRRVLWGWSAVFGVLALLLLALSVLLGLTLP